MSLCPCGCNPCLPLASHIFRRDVVSVSHLMRAFAQMEFCYVAVPTQNLKASGIPIFPKPVIKTTTTAFISTKNLSPVYAPSTINMVNSQKSNIGFTTASTLVAILHNHLYSNLSAVSRKACFIFLRVFQNPLVVSNTAFLFVFFRTVIPPFPSVFNAFRTLLLFFHRGVFAASSTQSQGESFVVKLFIIRHGCYRKHLPYLEGCSISSEGFL